MIEEEEEDNDAKNQAEQQCQDEAIAEAIAEEETLSKQIEEEESKLILVETDEGESDYGVSLLKNLFSSFGQQSSKNLVETVITCLIKLHLVKTCRTVSWLGRYAILWYI